MCWFLLSIFVSLSLTLAYKQHGCGLNIDGQEGNEMQMNDGVKDDDGAHEHSMGELSKKTISQQEGKRLKVKHMKEWMGKNGLKE